jgi:hypothetical protein
MSTPTPYSIPPKYEAAKTDFDKVLHIGARQGVEFIEPHNQYSLIFYSIQPYRLEPEILEEERERKVVILEYPINSISTQKIKIPPRQKTRIVFKKFPTQTRNYALIHGHPYCKQREILR